MIRMFLLLFFLSFPLEGCYAQNQTKPAGETKHTDPYSWHFGRVRQGQILKHVFVLKNDSSQTLTIKDINTSCGCTVSRVLKKVIPPGKRTLIEVRFNTKGYVGLVQQYIYVHTDSLDQPILRFIIKSEVIKTVQ